MECARFGFINVEPDTIECEACNERVKLEIPDNVEHDNQEGGLIELIV